MREKLLFDFNWQFHDGDIEIPVQTTKMPMYFQAKTERAISGPASYGYQETSMICNEKWDTVDLPHDYIIAQTPRPGNNSTLGFFDYHNAWYRNRFRLGDADRDRRLVLFFEGVAVHATIYVNGCLMFRNFCGYTSFEVDFTDVARFGEDNVVAVYVDASEHEGWWYEGAGIYRHVWLIKTAPVSVDLWGVYVNPTLTAGQTWQVPVETTLRNDALADSTVVVRSAIIDPDGRTIASAETPLQVPRKNKAVLNQQLAVTGPSLWDLEQPRLYTLQTTVLQGEAAIDQTDTSFGFRTIRFDAAAGFFLNGKSVKIKGVCCHQDYGLTGKAVPDRVHEYRLRRLKEMGANGYRTSHYPPAEAAMDAMDRLGFLVMDETRWFETTPEGLAQLEMMLKRDRNRPSVVLWSIGNEEPLHMTEAGKRLVETMTAFVKRYDTTRPVTTAISNDPLHSTAAAVSEVIGINYNMHQYDDIHAKYPDLPAVAAECCAVGTTRGWYLPDDEKRGYFWAHDHSVGGFVSDRETTWKMIAERPWVAGEYQWAGIEHRGETNWPRLCSQSGALDLFLQRKDAWYQNLSHWSDQPMVHILPHWNHTGREGEILPVWVYSNCEEIELFQDGSSLGKLQPGRYGHGEWQVAWRPGSLKVIGRIGGKDSIVETITTTGPAAALRLRLEDAGVRADNEDLAIITCFCVDAEGREVPDAAPFIHFDTNQFGTIAGTGSDVCDHTAVPSPDRQMRAGLCAVAVKTRAQAGCLSVYARADGLQPTRLDIDLVDSGRRPWVQHKR